MADTKLSALAALTGASVDPAADLLYIDDVSVTTSKSILVEQLGIALNATQAKQEAGTDNKSLVSPAVQQFHPSSSKCWGRVTVSGGTPTLQESYNITSITDDGVGLTTVTIATDFSSGGYAILLTLYRTASGATSLQVSAIAAGTFQVRAVNTSDGTPTDSYDGFFFACFGDQ